LSAVTQPSVSIVLATYNRRDWMRLAIDSVLDQSYSNLELLVMDDGSTDGTPELLEEYARRCPPERFRYSRHDNMGQARTLNRGYDMARGEVLGYLSDDDLLARGAVARLVAELRADPDAVAAYPGYRMIDQEGEIVDTVRPIEYSPLEAFRLHDTIIGPGGLVRREVLEASGGWDPAWHWMGDLILWMRVGLAGRVIRVEHPVASWRRHPGGITIETSLERARQHLRLVDVGASLLDLPDDAVGLRAEALRNACVIGAYFGGGLEIAGGPPFMAIDLQRPQISAFAAGLGPGDLLDERADEAARLWRELAPLTVEVSRLRTRGGEARGRAGATADESGGGLAAAVARLRGVGALPDERGRLADAAEGEMQAALWEAANDCLPDVDLATTRYLLVDLREKALTEDEIGQLTIDAFHASIPRLRNAIAAHRREIESARNPSPR
jgi:glycosyltransferase involved in cell wall biosynthesis